MIDFHAEQASIHQFRQSVTRNNSVCSTCSRVGQHRHSTGSPNETNCIDGVWGVMRFNVAAARMQDAGEGLAPISHVSTCHERVRNMWPSDGGTIGGLLEHISPIELVIR